MGPSTTSATSTVCSPTTSATSTVCSPTTSTTILPASAASTVHPASAAAELCPESPIFTTAAAVFQDPSACWPQPRPVSASVQPATAPAVPGSVSEISVDREDVSFKIIIYKMKYIYFE